MTASIETPRNAVPPALRLAEPSGWTPAQRERFSQELLDLFAQQALEVPVPVFLAALTIAAVVWNKTDATVIALWLVAVGTMLALRRHLITKLALRADIPAARRVRLAVMTSIGSGIVHGAAIWLFFPVLDVLERALMTMVMVGLVSGAVAILAGHLPSFAAYAVPVLIPLAGWWALRPTGTPDHAWLEPAVGVLTVVLGVVTARFAGLSQRLLRRAFAAGLAEEAAREQAELGWREAQVQLQRAEAASQAKTRFLSAASHDLRQPLQAMQWLGDSLVDADRDDRKQIVLRMGEAIESLEGLLKKLLDRSQLDAGVVEPDISSFDLAALVEQVQRDFSAKATGKGLELAASCAPGLLVSSDRTLLLSILRNLLENAIKYTDRGRVEITAHPRYDAVTIRVADSGRGIAAQERTRVFEEFYQVDNRRRDSSRGFGLGLSIVRGYCDLLGIELTLHSTLGQGTKFELAVPLARFPEAVESNELGHLGDDTLPAGLHVLVVEDDTRVLEAERSMLERRGCVVSAARTVAEARRIASANHLDLLVTDYQLPDGTGFDVIRALKSDRIDPLAALIITGDTGATELRALSESGYEWLTKPVKPIPLIRAMQRALARGVDSAPSG